MLDAKAAAWGRRADLGTGSIFRTIQSAAVNVRLETDAVPSAALLDAIGITTSAVGWLFNTTVKLAAAPASVVARPAVGVTVMAAASLSALLNETSAASMPL